MWRRRFPDAPISAAPEVVVEMAVYRSAAAVRSHSVSAKSSARKKKGRSRNERRTRAFECSQVKFAEVFRDSDLSMREKGIVSSALRLPVTFREA